MLLTFQLSDQTIIIGNIKGAIELPMNCDSFLFSLILLIEIMILILARFDKELISYYDSNDH